MKLSHILTSIIVGGLVTSATLLLLMPLSKDMQDVLPPEPPKKDTDQKKTAEPASILNGQSSKSTSTQKEKKQKKQKKDKTEEYYHGFKVHTGAKGGKYYFDENGSKKYLKPKK